MHSEQMKLKNEQIQSKNEVIASKDAVIETLKLQQSDIILEKYNLEQEFYKDLVKTLRDSVTIEKEHRIRATINAYKIADSITQAGRSNRFSKFLLLAMFKEIVGDTINLDDLIIDKPTFEKN